MMVYGLLLISFGVLNFLLGMFMAAQFGIGPLRDCRAARFLAQPALAPPGVLMGLAWRLRKRRRKSLVRANSASALTEMGPSAEAGESGEAERR